MLFPAAHHVSAPERVVVTGAGIITGLGAGWKPNAEGFRAGRAAFRPVSLFDVSRHRAKTAAEVDLPAGLPATRLTRRQLARLDRGGAMLLLAAHDCWQQAGWNGSEDVPFVLGTTAGGMVLGEAYFRQATRAPDRRRQQPTRALHYQAHTQARDSNPRARCITRRTPRPAW